MKARPANLTIICVVALVALVAIVAIVFGREFRGSVTSRSVTVQTNPVAPEPNQSISSIENTTGTPTDKPGDTRN